MKGLFEPTWFIIMSAQVFIVPASNLNVNTIGISIWGDRAKQILLSHGSPFSIRMPVFWDTPTAPWLLIPVIHIRTPVKTRQTQSYKFWKIAKKNLILQTNLHLPIKGWSTSANNSGLPNYRKCKYTFLIPPIYSTWQELMKWSY